MVAALDKSHVINSISEMVVKTTMLFTSEFFVTLRTTESVTFSDNVNELDRILAISVLV
jgi:hypothetical protein